MAPKRSYETSIDVASVYNYATEHRPKRLMMKREPTDDAMALSSDGAHDLLYSMHDPHDNPYYSKKHIIVKDCDLMLRDYQENAIHTLYEQDGINALHIPCRMGKTREAVEQQEQETREYIVALCISPWERQRLRWMAMYEKIQKAPSQSSKETDEKRAGVWQKNQRITKKKMSAERIKALEEIPGWTWSAK